MGAAIAAAEVREVAVALGATMVELMADVEAEKLPGEEPPPLPRGRPKKKRARGRAPGSSVDQRGTAGE